MSLWDDFKLGVAGIADLANPINWATGASPLVGLALESEKAEAEGRDFDVFEGVRIGTDGLKKTKAAASKTADQVKEKVKRAVDWLPWVAVGAGVIALAVYVGPAIIAGRVAKS